DWSSDVCSSDLHAERLFGVKQARVETPAIAEHHWHAPKRDIRWQVCGPLRDFRIKRVTMRTAVQEELDNRNPVARVVNRLRNDPVMFSCHVAQYQRPGHGAGGEDAAQQQTKPTPCDAMAAAFRQTHARFRIHPCGTRQPLADAPSEFLSEAPPEPLSVASLDALSLAFSGGFCSRAPLVFCCFALAGIRPVTSA